MRQSLARTAVALAITGAIGGPSFAGDAAAVPTPLGPNPEIVRALAEVRRQYGADAVLLEGLLLSNSIQAGSVLETAVTVGGIEERDARKYLTFTVETGIVYNDHELSADARLGRTWTRIVERSLRMFRSITVPADGVHLVVTSLHKPYRDEPDLRSHLSEGHGESESAVFYLLTTDVNELMAAKLDGQQLADRAVVLVDGTPRHVRVEPPETPVPESPPAAP